MTVQTLRPDSTEVAGGWVASSASLHADTSDDSDATYAEYTDSTLAVNGFLGLGTYALAADERVKLLRVRHRTSSDGSDSVAVKVLVNEGGLVGSVSSTVDGTTPTDFGSGWVLPGDEVVQADVDDVLVRLGQTFREGSANALIYELYLDLDVRERPVVNTVTPTVTLGSPSWVVDWTYGTSGRQESVRVEVVVTDSNGDVVETVQKQVTGTDFSGETTTLESTVQGSYDDGTYTATATVSQGGFPGSDARFTSDEVDASFSVSVAGVPTPTVTCSPDHDTQSVVMEIEQPDVSAGALTDCLVIEASDVAFTSGAVNETVVVVGTPRHAAVWISNELVTTEIEFDGNNVHVRWTATGSGTARVVVATTGGTENTGFVSRQITAPTTVVHNLDTTDLIVQARDDDGMQATIAVDIVDADTIEVGGSFAETINVLVLGEVAADEECIATDDITVPDGGGTFTHQFASTATLATAVDSANLVVWTDIELGSGFVTVENDTGSDLTVHLSGLLATFDDTDQVRVEVHRDGELEPMDNQGALVPAPTTGTLTVRDRFLSCRPVRAANYLTDDSDTVLTTDSGEPLLTSGTDCEPTADCCEMPEYRVRFYGYVDGMLVNSGWTTCTPDRVNFDGDGWLRHPTDLSLDIASCVETQPWTRDRPTIIAQPIGGGLPFAATGDPSGRNFQLGIRTETTTEALTVEATLDSQLLFYQPIDPCVPGAWVVPDSSRQVSGAPVPGRPHLLQQGFVEVNHEPVDLPAVEEPSGSS